MSEKNPFKAGKFEPSPEQQRQLEVFSRRLEAIAKQVSGDSTLHVAPGKPGSGEWYFKPDTNEIRWDPAEVLMKAEDAEEEVMGKMAHEGGHRAVTRWRDVVDMKQLKETLGLHAVLAAVEERPTDQVVRDRYEGAGRWLNAARQGSIREGAEAR